MGIIYQSCEISKYDSDVGNIDIEHLYILISDQSPKSRMGAVWNI